MFRNKKLLILAIGVFLTACSLIPWRRFSTRPMVQPGIFENDRYSSNGEQIYFSGTDQYGRQIPYTEGPTLGSGMMMGSSQLSCDSCHGQDGRGGVHIMQMQIMDAPNIRFEVLVSEGDEHGVEGGEEQQEHEIDSYDLDVFSQAVIYGQHPDGESLNSDMPRWNLNDDELADLFEFIKSFP